MLVTYPTTVEAVEQFVSFLTSQLNILSV